MKKNATLFALLLLLMLAAFNQNSYAAKCYINGTITDYWTGAGISGVTINRYNDTGTVFLGYSTTDAFGNYDFEFKGIVTDTDYIIDPVDPVGYNVHQVIVSPPVNLGGGAATVSCSGTITTYVTINFERVRESTNFAGQVFNGNTMLGLSNRTVTLNLRDVNGNLTGSTYYTSTDSSGNYTAPSLPCYYTYDVTVTPNSGETVTALYGSGSTYVSASCDYAANTGLDFSIVP